MAHKPRGADPAPITPGFYFLPEDVPNPAPDRRKVYDWSARETIAHGTRLHARDSTHIRMTEGPLSQEIHINHPLFAMLAAKMIPDPVRDLDTIVAAHGRPSFRSIVEALLANGAITLDTLESTLLKMDSEP